MVRSKKEKPERYFAITRELSKSGEFKKAMESCGWTVIFLKCIVISPKPHFELERIVSNIIQNKYEACVFLSANTADILMTNANNTGHAFAMISKLRSIRTICVGPKTAKTLSQYGIQSVIVPKSHNTQGLVKCLSNYKSQVHRIVIPRSQLGDDEIVLSLSRLGFFVDQYRLYDVSTNLIIDNQWKWFFYLLRDKSLDAVGFTSPSSVKSLFQIVKNQASNDDLSYLQSHNALVSIGQKTSEELKKHASGRIVEAVEHTLNGMAEASTLI